MTVQGHDGHNGVIEEVIGKEIRCLPLPLLAWRYIVAKTKQDRGGHAMAIVVVSRWKGNYARALPIARQAAAILKQQGASSARIGRCHSGPDTGQIYTAITYPDWTTYGSAQQQSQAGDSEFQRVFAEFAKVVELQDRSVIVADDL